jgi:hypothetical protein
LSSVDAKLAPGEREAFLHEIRNHLPAFLSAAATEREDPAGDVQDLLNLRREDLRRVIAVHLGLSPPIVDFVAGLGDGLRNPRTSSERPLVSSQAVRGPIDWSATIRERATSGWDVTRYVVRPARRIFDIPENRALVWLLDRLDAELRRVAPADSDPATGVNTSGWFARVVEMRARIQIAKRHHWVRGIPGERPDARAIQALRASRTGFYRHLIPGAVAQLSRFVEREPTAPDLTELLCARYFEPERDWRLFELLVALRLARAIAEHSTAKRKSRLLVGAGRAPFARYAMSDGDEIRLWYQAWPRDIGLSVHEDARSHYEIDAGHARPDVVIQRVRDGKTIDALLLELKASRSGGTLGAGLLQLLGYLKDRPELFTTRPSAWLVAPPSTAFISKDPDSRELWAVDSEAVAAAAVARLTSPVAQ